MLKHLHQEDYCHFQALNIKIKKQGVPCWLRGYRKQNPGSQKLRLSNS
jgi:hypothetical protein